MTLTIQGLDPIIALKQAVVKENLVGSFELSTLQPDFYQNMKSFINSYTPQDQDWTPESDKPKPILRADLVGYFNQLYYKRKAKISRFAMTTIPANQIEGKLTVEELEAFKAIRATYHNLDYNVGGIPPDMALKSLL